VDEGAIERLGRTVDFTVTEVDLEPERQARRRFHVEKFEVALERTHGSGLVGDLGGECG